MKVLAGVDRSQRGYHGLFMHEDRARDQQVTPCDIDKT